MMHMMWAALVAAVTPLDFINAMFCGTVLLHKGHNMKAVKTAIRKYLQNNLVIVYEEPDADTIAYNTAVMGMLDYMDQDMLDHARIQDPQWLINKRRRARKLLISTTPAKLDGTGKPVHFCSLLCDCKSYDDAVVYASVRKK